MADMLIDNQRRLAAKDAKIQKLEKAVGEIQQASDILMGHVIRAYGYEAGDRLMLDLPTFKERYRISTERTDTGYLLKAVKIDE